MYIPIDCMGDSLVSNDDIRMKTTNRMFFCDCKKHPGSVGSGATLTIDYYPGKHIILPVPNQTLLTDKRVEGLRKEVKHRRPEQD